jgi:hypothetical protein
MELFLGNLVKNLSFLDLGCDLLFHRHLLLFCFCQSLERESHHLQGLLDQQDQLALQGLHLE